MNTLVTHIRQLATPTGAQSARGAQMAALSIRDNVHVLIRDDRFVSVTEDVPHVAVDTTVDAMGAVAIPGLIDPLLWAAADDHLGPRLSHGANPPSRDRPVPLDPASIEMRIRRAFSQILRHGTTSVEVRVPATSGWDTLETVLTAVQLAGQRTSVRTGTCFLAAPPDGPTRSNDDRITTLIGETIPGIQRHRLASSCAVLCGGGGYGRKEGKAILRAARGAGLEVKVQTTGSGIDAVLLAAELESSTLDHLTRAGRTELDQLSRAGVLPVLLPGEPFLLDQPWADARRFIDSGLPVALASGADVVVGGILSMATVISLAVRKMALTLDEALTAATLNAAAALGQAHHLGTIEPGKRANLVLLDVEDYRQIEDFVVGLPVRDVILGGKVATWR